jgi:hypothetical protein
MGPETTYQHISSIFALVLAKVANNRVLWCLRIVLLLCGTTGEDFGLVTNWG